MNFKLKGTILLNGDISFPEIPYAEFSKDLDPSIMKSMVLTLNHGHDMLMIYKQYRYNINVKRLAEMFDKMEEIYQKYSFGIYTNKKG
jgi:hypothetical protein